MQKSSKVVSNSDTIPSVLAVLFLLTFASESSTVFRISNPPVVLCIVLSLWKRFPIYSFQRCRISPSLIRVFHHLILCSLWMSKFSILLVPFRIKYFIAGVNWILLKRKNIVCLSGIALCRIDHK